LAKFLGRFILGRGGFEPTAGFAFGGRGSPGALGYGVPLHDFGHEPLPERDRRSLRIASRDLAVHDPIPAFLDNKNRPATPTRYIIGQLVDVGDVECQLPTDGTRLALERGIVNGDTGYSGHASSESPSGLTTAFLI
jgi:hypothetical protein